MEVIRSAWRLLRHGFGRIEEAWQRTRRIEKQLDEVRPQLDQMRRQLDRVSHQLEERLSRRVVPMTLSDDEAAIQWEPIGDGVAAPDPEGREWTVLEACPVCGAAERTLVNPWNKFILMAKSIDGDAARYDYSVCHACGVCFASRRPRGSRYRFMLEHFGEATAKRGGGAAIPNRVLNPYPLTEADRAELRRRAEPGVFVSDHLGLKSDQYLAALLRDRFGNSVHADVIGTLVEPRGARVLEVRSRAGTILDALRRAYGAEVYAMPIWESQQFLLREVYGIETSDLIDFEHFAIPFEGPFDVIVCNHMLTHILDPRALFAELRRTLRPGGYVYLHHEPDDAEYLAGNQSMLSTLNPLHMQAFDQRSLERALAANGFEVVFMKRHDLNHLCLARMADTAMAPMRGAERNRRIQKFRDAYDRAVLQAGEAVRPRFAAEWEALVSRAVARGLARLDEAGHVRIVVR